MNLSDQAKAALAYWPQIEYAADNGLTTADMWGIIRDAAEDLGLASPGVTVQGVSQLRGLASGIQRRADQFNAFPDSKRLPGTAWSEAPWSRSLADQRAMPKWQVRFQHTFLVNGAEVTEWRSTVRSGRTPRTKGELLGVVDEDAENMARDYGVEHVGTSGHQLLVI